MQELAWLAEVIRIWLEGGTWADIKAAPGFVTLMFLGATLIPSSIILLGISGAADWRETPLAMWFGLGPRPEHDDWAERARDLDKDGIPDL